MYSPFSFYLKQLAWFKADYARFDIRIAYRLMKKKITLEWALDIQNLLNRENIFQEKYDSVSEEVITEYQTGLFPMVTFKIYY